MLNQRFNIFNDFYKIMLLKKANTFTHFETYHHDTNSIFIHVPKAAGMSLVDAVYGQSQSKHSKCIDFYKEDSDKFNRYFKFAIVREPTDRCFSAYNYLLQGGQSSIDKYWRDRFIKGYADFDDFVLNGGLIKAVIKGAEHFIPQHEFICINGEIAVDYIGKFESFSDCVDNIKNHVRFSSELKKLNSTKIKAELKVGNDVSKKIREIYDRDFELFCY